MNLSTVIVGLTILAPFIGCAWAWLPKGQRGELARRTKRRMVSGRRERARLGLVP